MLLEEDLWQASSSYSTGVARSPSFTRPYERRLIRRMVISCGG